MNLSSIIAGVPDYLEYAWLTAPNTDKQSLLTNGSPTTLTLTNEIIDTGNNGSISSNQITLNAGTYYFEATAPIWARGADGGVWGGWLVLMLADVTTGVNVVRSKPNWIGNGDVNLSSTIIVPANGTKYELRSIINLHSEDTMSVAVSYYRTYSGDKSFTVTTPNIQRTTIKLWKLK